MRSEDATDKLIRMMTTLADKFDAHAARGNVEDVQAAAAAASAYATVVSAMFEIHAKLETRQSDAAATVQQQPVTPRPEVPKDFPV